MNHLTQITKSDGTKEIFEEEKLRSSLKRVGTSEQVIDDIVEEVGKNIKTDMTTTHIYELAFAMLKKHSMPVAVKYSIRRALMELGPEGFPFEKMVARIFRMWGYETLTDQTLVGSCVPHEMDVVAWKGKELAMVEAKYHNGFDLKSDIKVVLYINSRFDDLADTVMDYGTGPLKLTERYLVTNTKFTDRAIAYGKCKNIKMIGWNYPEKGNLHQIMEENGLHPITCLNALTNQQKKDLIVADILVCSDLISQSDRLAGLGFKNDSISKIIDEAKMIVSQVV
jgi:hypothetical protein